VTEGKIYTGGGFPPQPFRFNIFSFFSLRDGLLKFRSEFQKFSKQIYIYFRIFPRLSFVMNANFDTLFCLQVVSNLTHVYLAAYSMGTEPG
jgi:hypothetical protein